MMSNLLYRLYCLEQRRVAGPLKNERGAEIAEVGIWLALIVAISIAIITTLGTDIKSAFNKVEAQLPAS